MAKPAVTVVTTLISVAVGVACTERVTAPEAVEIVKTVEQSFVSGEVPERWLGNVMIFPNDPRLRAPLPSIDLLRDGKPLPYQAIVFERIVLPSVQLGAAICPGTRRVAYFRRASDDGIAFYAKGPFDERLAPPATCMWDGVEQPATVTAMTSDKEAWIRESVEGDISPGVVTGTCGFLEPEAERILREEHGITCEVTNHSVQLAARLRGYSVGGPDSMRIDLDPTAISGVRYTIDCDAAKNKSVSPCEHPSRASSPGIKFRGAQ